MWKFTRTTLLIFSISCLIFISGCSSNDSNTEVYEVPSEGLDLIEEVWQMILDDYIDHDSITTEELTDGAIRGLVDALGDPYAAYFNAEQNRDFQQKLNGEYGGIGATLTIREGLLTVVAPVAGSPAEKAGIITGDVILEINGEVASKMSLSEAALKVRGTKGTLVKLLILHPDETTPVEIDIQRDDIELESVAWEMLPGDIAHIVLTGFAENTEPELADALKVIVLEQKAKGIILDLRDNGGGLVSSAVNVVDKFIEESLVVYALDNEGKRTEWSVHHRGIAQDLPLAVLVNGNSASASEIVAGAIQDNDRGPVIGVQTFGKGQAQLIRQLSSGGSLKITYSRWFTPDGQQIDGEGITPDIVVEITDADIESGTDPQLQRAVSYLNESM